MSRGAKIFWGFCIILFAVSIACSIKLSVHMHEVAAKYNEAVELIMADKHTEGRLILEEIKDEDYLDTHDFITYCRMVERKDGKSVSFSWYDVRHIEFCNCAEGQRIELLNELSELKDWYDARDKERERQHQLAEEKRVRSGIPYVGMSEDYIAKTSLGVPSTNTHSNYEVINGNQYRATIYDFIENGRVIFSVRCVRGYVTQVWDMRDYEPYIPDCNRQNDDDDDPYNASDYSNEEDFYLDHYYDFHDYYQAEKYWREHRDD